MLYVVRYAGPFGYIKPWTAVRDSLTFSEKFLPPATVQGISQKLFGLEVRDAILRYRLAFDAYSRMQEQTRAKQYVYKRDNKLNASYLDYGMSVLERGVLLNPELLLAFANETDARIAAEQHVCLCRNEDLLLPDAGFGDEGVLPMTETDFDARDGFEMRPAAPNETGAVPAGRNRLEPGHPMTWGRLSVTGVPVRQAF